MRFVNLTMILALSLLVASSGLVFGQLSEEYADWAEGPEGFLLTKEEKKEWKKVASDREAKHFIELFWARRNPNPSSGFNEFRARFDSMVTYCDREFSSEDKLGSLSDRGRVFLLLGPPHQAQRRAPTETVRAQIGTPSDRGTDEVRATAVMWVYDPMKLDPELKAKGTRILFTFYEERTDTNHFVLDRSHQEAMMALRLLDRAPEIYLLHPDLETVPKPVSVPGGTPASEAQLTVFGTDSGSLQSQLHAMTDIGVANADQRPVWLHFGLPADSPEIDTLAGRVLAAADDEVLSTFQISAKPVEGGTERAYHLTVPLAQGDYRLEVAGLSGTEAQFVYKDAVTVPAAGDGPWMSELWVGLNAFQNPEAALGQAYHFGTLHLVPLNVKAAPKNSELSYFGFVTHPPVEEGVDLKLKLKLTVRKDGKRLGRPLRMDLPAMKVADDLYYYANGLNLAAFPSGECELEFEVSLPGTELVEQRSFVLNVVE